MSDNLNPLKFQVAIEDMATKQLENIKTKLNSLKNFDIQLNVVGADKIKASLNISETVSQIQKAINAVKGNNFDAFAKSIDRVDASLKTMTTTLQGLNAEAANSQNLQSLISGMSASVRNVRSMMQQVEGGKNSTASQADIYVRNVQKMEDALYRIQEARAKVGIAMKEGAAAGMNVDGMKIYMKLLDSYEKKLQNIRSNPLMMNERGWQTQTFGTTFKHLLANAGDFQKQVDSFVQKQNLLETNQRRFNVALEESEALLKRLDNAGAKGASFGLDTLKVDKAFNEMQQFIDKMLMFDSGNLGNNHMINELIAEYTRLKSTLTSVVSEQERANNATEKANKKAADSATKKAQKDNESWADSMRRAGVEATKLEIKIRQLKDVESRGQKTGADTTELSAKIAELEKYASALRQIESGFRGYGKTKGLMDDINKTTMLANEQATAVTRAANANEQAARAASQHTAEQQRLSQAFSQSTSEAHRHSQILSDLRSLATQYLGVWGGQQFLNNIIEIGGQLEMQRLSIGAILQDTAQANTLFDKIKSMAVKSPFGVVELDQMTKQLTAYGFKYNELFDMTKRLADISAATGTGVDRLALALGHVRSEAALSGYTLRQFSMANVPLLQRLSEKLGKTTQEIRKMVRSKDISYQDVIDVLKDLTDEGGMFYNMQDVISQSVKARYKNVKDAMDIMYGEMAEGFAGDSLKKVADMLMTVTQNWRDAATVLGTGAAVWGIQKAAILLYNYVLGEANATTLQTIATFRTKEAAQLRIARMYRTMSDAEAMQIASSKRYTTSERIRLLTGRELTTEQQKRIVASRQQVIMDQALALSSKKLTTEDIARQVALGKLSKTEARRIIMLADMTAAERTAAIAAINNVKTYGRFTGVLNGAKIAAQGLVTALKAVVANPMMWIMAAMTAVMELWQHNKREMEAAEELSGKIYEHSQEALKNTRTMMGNTGISVKWREGDGVDWSDVTGSFGTKTSGETKIELPEFDTNNARESIEEWAQYIRDYAATPNRLLNDALFDTENRVRSIKEQYDNLKESVESVVLAQSQLKDMGNAFKNAVEFTDGGWFDHNVTTDIRQYDKEVGQFTQNLTSVYGKYRQYVDAGIKAAEEQNAAFAKATKSMDTYIQKFKFLIENQSDFADAASIFTGNGYVQKTAFEDATKPGARTGIAEVKSKRKEMESEIDAFFLQLEIEFELLGYTKKKIKKDESIQQTLLLAFKDYLSTINGLSTETGNNLMNKFAAHFGITLDVDDEKFRIVESDVTRMLKELSESEWKVDLNFATNIDDVIDEVRKQYKAAKEYFEKIEPVLLKFGVEMELGDTLTDEQIDAIVDSIPEQSKFFVRQVLTGANEHSRNYNQATKAAENGGFSLEDEKKKKTTGSYKDETAKRWDERVRIMKEAYDWYDKWEKKVGEEEAFNKVNERYKDIFKEWRTDKVLPFKFDAKNVKDYLSYVEKIRDDALRRYRAQKNNDEENNGQEALRVYRQAVSILEDAKLDNFTRAAEEFCSVIEKTMDDIQRKWDIYDKVLSATGSREDAWTMAGMTGDERNANSLAQALRNEMRKQFGSGEELVFNANFDSDKIRKMFEDAIPKPDESDEAAMVTYMRKIDGFIKLYEGWQKEEIAEYKRAVDAYVSLTASLVDTQSVTMRAIGEYADTMESLKPMAEINPQGYKAASTAAYLRLQDKIFKAQDSYQLLMDGVVTINRDAAKKVRKDYVELLDAQLKAGVITAKQYADELENINEKMRNLENLPSYGRSYMQGGISGVTDNMNQRGKSLMEQGSTYVQQGAKTMNSEMVKTGGYMQKVGAGMQNAAGKMNNTVAIIDLIVHGINDMVQGLKGVWDEINETLQAYGDDSQKTGMGAKVNTFLGAFSQASQGATDAWDALKSGNGAGVILGVVKSWTGWFKGFAEGHDAEMDEYIKNAQSNQKRLENIYSDIERDVNRSFGYGTMSQASLQELRKERNKEAVMRSFYGSGDRSDETFNAMNNALKSGSVYAGEYATLLAQRDSAQNKLASEQDKKDSDADDIEAYREEIAALNEQIAEFGKNLAKELWGIDVKGWADQIGDALMNAFENGEDAAKAFADVTRSILQGVASRILKLGILKPMMQKLEERLFGKKDANGNYKGGSIDIDDMLSNPQSAGTKIAGETNKWFNEYGKKMIQAYQEGFISLNNLFDGALTNPNNNTLSSSIQGTAEETSDLLAGYVNTLRQDVAFNRLMLEQFISDMWPDYLKSIEAQGLVLGHIDQNVQSIANMMMLGSGALYEQIEAMRMRFDNVVNGVDKVWVN